MLGRAASGFYEIWKLTSVIGRAHDPTYGTQKPSGVRVDGFKGSSAATLWESSAETADKMASAVLRTRGKALGTAFLGW